MVAVSGGENARLSGGGGEIVVDGELIVAGLLPARGESLHRHDFGLRHLQQIGLRYRKRGGLGAALGSLLEAVRGSFGLRAMHQAMSTEPLPLAAAAADQLGTTHAQHFLLNKLRARARTVTH